MAGRTRERSCVENSNKKIKVLVLGAGFTGILSAVSIKQHVPNSEVWIIDPNTEMKMLGLGLSLPASSVNQLAWLLKTCAPLELMRRIMCQTVSTPKINVKWQNFRSQIDNGWFSGLPMLPSADIIHYPALTTNALANHVVFPTNEQYQLPDIWIELYLAGRRKLEDFAPDINAYFWYCQQHTMPRHDIFTVLPTIHTNNWNFGSWMKSNFASLLDGIYEQDVNAVTTDNQGNISGVILANGQTVTADFYVDCTGFRRVIGRTLELPFVQAPTEVYNNCAVVVGQKWGADLVKEMHLYTTGYGMDYGWTFGIPMRHAKSYGYNFNTDFCSPDQALAELEQLAPADQRIYDPEILKWQPGYYSASMDKNYALVGISSGFHDPFEAHSVGLQLGQIRTILKYMQDADQRDNQTQYYNRFTKDSFESLAQRLEFHMCLAPRDTSEYWKYNHQVAKKRNLAETIFDVINDPCHYEPARADSSYKPYPGQCYLTESLYFGLDMSRRCRASTPELLQLADNYFKTFNQLNQMRANLAPGLKQWYHDFGTAIDQINLA